MLDGLAVLVMVSVTQSHGMIWGALAYLAALLISGRVDEAIARRRPSGVHHRDLPLSDGGTQRWTLTVERTDNQVEGTGGGLR